MSILANGGLLSHVGLSPFPMVRGTTSAVESPTTQPAVVPSLAAFNLSDWLSDLFGGDDAEDIDPGDTGSAPKGETGPAPMVLGLPQDFVFAVMALIVVGAVAWRRA